MDATEFTHIFPVCFMLSLSQAQRHTTAERFSATDEPILTHHPPQMPLLYTRIRN